MSAITSHSAPQNTLFSQLSEDALSRISSFLDADHLALLLLSGDSKLRYVLLNGAIRAWHVKTRTFFFDSKTKPFWRSLSKFSRLRRLSLRFEHQFTSHSNLRIKHLRQLPETLRIFETDASLDFSESKKLRFPSNLASLEVLECRQILLPDTQEEKLFKLPENLQKLIIHRSDHARFILPSSLTELAPRLDFSSNYATDKVPDLRGLELPPFLESLSWPFHTAVLWPHPSPATLKSLLIGSLLDMSVILRDQNNPHPNLWAQLPNRLTSLNIQTSRVSFSALDIQSLPRSLVSLQLEVRIQGKPVIDAEIAAALPPKLTTFKSFVANGWNAKAALISSDAIPFLPRTLKTLYLFEYCHIEDLEVSRSRFLEGSAAPNSIDKKTLSALPSVTSLYASGIQFSSVLALPYAGLQFLKCDLKLDQVPHLDEMKMLSTLVCRLLPSSDGKIRPIRFPDSVIRLSVSLEFNSTLSQVPSFPRHCAYLYCCFNGSFEPQLSPQWIASGGLPNDLVNLTLEGKAWHYGKCWLKQLGNTNQFPHLEQLSLFVEPFPYYAVYHTTLNAHPSVKLKSSHLRHLPRTLREVKVHISDPLQLKHLSKLPPKIQALAISSNIPESLSIDDPGQFVLSLPPSLSTLRIPVTDQALFGSPPNLQTIFSDAGVTLISTLPDFEMEYS